MTKRSKEVGATIRRIRNPQAYEDGQWDLDIFEGCFGGRIKASDIDGVVERKGHVLFFEFKSPGREVDTGQDLLFRALQRPANQHVIVVEGRRHSPVRYAFWGDEGPKGWTKCDLKSLRKRVASWYRWANGQPAPPESPRVGEIEIEPDAEMGAFLERVFAASPGEPW